MVLTAKQLKLLGILYRHGDPAEGTMEVLLAWGDYDFEEHGDDDGIRSWRLAKFVVGNLMRSLAKKGLATIVNDGYGITEKGKEVYLGLVATGS